MFRVLNQNGFSDLKYYGNSIETNKAIYILTGPILLQPTRTSIQIGPRQHIEDEWGQYINHDCNPTVKVVGNMLVAVRQIDYGDSITFNYNETEDVVSNPFVCHCCGKQILGKYLKK